METKISIITFLPQHANAFRDLNYEWLQRYFVVEPHDEEVLTQPYEFILDIGGEILMAVDGNAPVGTVALIPHPNGKMELAKMAVTQSHQGLGIGKLLLDSAIQKAKDMGLQGIFLVSATKLLPALALYKSRGFIETEIDPNDYQRCDIQMALVF